MEQKVYELAEHAILVDLDFGQGSIYSRSKELTREAAENHDADINSVSGNVIKLEAADRKEITKVINEADAIWKSHTVAWNNLGARLCPAANYEPMMVKLRDCQNRFYDAVEGLIFRYDELLSDFQKRKGSISDVEFPSRDRLRRSFRFDIVKQGISNPADIRLRMIDKKTVAEIKRDALADMQKRMAGVSSEIATRLSDAVRRIQGQTEKEGPIFQVTFNHLNEMLEVLPSLNALVGDPEIARLLADAKQALGSIDVAEIKNDKKARAATAAAAGSVLDALKNYGIK